MSAIQLTQADEINRLHSLATENAGRAIDYAKQAGIILLDIKRKLSHGEFLPWLSANVTVSERQAQRYIRAALGKATPVRAICKSDIVSDLPKWLPASGMVAEVKFNDEDLLMVQERPDAPGFYWVLFIYGSDAHWLKRGIRGDFVKQSLYEWLPGAYTSSGLESMQWEMTGPHDGDPVGSLIAGIAKVDEGVQL